MDTTKICVVCGKEFTRLKGRSYARWAAQRCCCNDCSCILRRKEEPISGIDRRKVFVDSAVKKLATKICVYCGKEYQPLIHNQRFCNRTCSTNSYRDERRAEVASYRQEIKRLQDIPKRKDPTIIETDADQARIKKAIDDRYSIGHCQGRSLKGTAEWDDVVKTITPLDRVPKRHAMPLMAPSKDNYGGIAR